MTFLKKKYAWALVYGLLLTAFTLYVVLDTFVIARAYVVVTPESAGAAEPAQPDADVTEEAQEEDPTQADASDAPEETVEEADSTQADTSESTDSPFTQSPVITENSYSDQNISITITQYREYDTSIYVADVTVSSAEYLKTALAASTYGKNVTEKTSEIAAENNAILAINGDYYGSQTKGYVLRNGVLYRESVSDGQEDLVIWQDGTFEIITEGAVSASELLAEGAAQILSFGPALVVGGDMTVTQNSEVGKAKTSNPRTAIGIIDDLHYVFVVADGRTDESEGLTLYQLAVFMQDIGVDTAYNLDGGGSSTMYFNGAVVNNPTSSGDKIKERSVSDIVYI